ncbi:flagellar filament capping protein FliD [Acetatifactor aquisgranensis]|uniref:flagellar filament capping protein FliD n=1 Tax=Acetatifactor aquisgranensis TaxID=2941233 RepID=UPI0020410E48|nr:flagellar filament capping protein FliD [Acetatifactor aquisgranensis]MCI8543487.1 flagellar filament capping protein FliD [Lachnospiraceae bacterium]
MGVRINVDGSQDYSYLFQSLSSSGSMGNLNFLSDYASIKNGSYGKLMKAYYSPGQSSSTSSDGTRRSSYNILEKLEAEKRNPKVSKDVQEANSKLKSGLSTLKNSISTLQNDATYSDTENGKTAADKVVSAVKSFVSNYNDVVTASKGSTLTSQTAYVANMMSTTAASADQLAEIGIKVNAKGTLEINEAKLKAADISKVQELFSSEEVMSYGSRLASRVQFAGSAGSTSSTNKTDTTTETDNKTNVSGAAGVKADGKTLASSELYEKVEDKDGNTDYDVAKIFATAKSFVNNYNRMLNAAESSSNSGVVANLSYIKSKTAANADALKQFGINVDTKGRMTINESTFKKSDMAQVQKFFKDYGSSVAGNASLVDYYMTTQANAANGYTANGAYNVGGGSGYTGIV